MAKLKSKFFRAFVAGNTITDGRVVTPKMIDEIVATFNAETYTPRINVEHIAGYSPQPPFNGYGDVIGARAQDDDLVVGGKPGKYRALYLQVEANDQLQALGANDQKPFPSVELTDSYAGTGKTGIVGLAFTDTPASIATQRLQFSRSSPGTVDAHAPDAVALEFEVAPAEPNSAEGAIANLFNTLAAKFRGAGGKAEAAPTAPPPAPAPTVTPPAAPAAPANDNDFAAFSREIGTTVGQAIAAALTPVTTQLNDLSGRFATLEGKVEATPAPNQFARPPASGGSGAIVTDC